MAEFLYYYDDRVLRDANKLIPTKPGEKNPKVIIALETTPIDIIIDMIIFATAPKELKILRILAHGRAGLTALGKDDLSDRTVDRFKKIKDRFAEGGRIELHSCSVAGFCTTALQCTIGTWLQKLSDFTGATVIAAHQKQTADDNWAWEGGTTTFEPGKPGSWVGVDPYYFYRGGHR